MRTVVILGLVFVVSILISATMVRGQAVSLDYVDGLHDSNSIAWGQRIMFRVRMTTDSLGCKGISNGFRIYSNSGAHWSTSTGDWTGAIDTTMFQMLWVVYDGVTGSGADTVGFAGIYWDQSTGIPPYFDAVAITLSIGPIDAEHEGKTVCLDSSFYPPNNVWQWVANNDNSDRIWPSWDGPHCFTVGRPPWCCRFRGDVEDKGAGPVHIGDLVWLTEYANEGGPPPPCLEQADVNGDGLIDDDDVDYLNAFMFSGGPPPVPCGEHD